MRNIFNSIVLLFCFSLNLSGQTFYNGRQYVMKDDEFYPFKFTREYSGGGDIFITTYTVYHPTKGTPYLTITATHDKRNRKVDVSIDEPNGGIFAHINTEKTTYNTPDLEPFGHRGDMSKLGGEKVPFQLAVQFVSDKFENIKVIEVNATEPATSNYIFYQLDNAVRHEAITKKTEKNVSAPMGGGDGDGNGPGKGTGMSFDLAGRRLLLKPIIDDKSAETGKVVVKISVDKSGIVTDAKPGGRGTTTTSAYLFAKAKEAAMKARFNASPEVEEIQNGTITFVFLVQ